MARIHAAVLLIVSLSSVVACGARAQVSDETRTPSMSQIEDFSIGLGAATPRGARPLVPLAPELIMHFEGWSARPYDDPSGYCTVGFGHLIEKKQCAELDLSKFPRPLSLAEGSVLLEADTLSARAAIQNLVKINLNDHEFGAIASFVFNVGKGNFAGSTMLKLLNDGHRQAAAREFARWIVSNGKVLSGLAIRRNCEAALFQGRLKGDNKRFVRSECSSLGAAPAAGTLIEIETGKQLQEAGR
jgi:lysozyme